MTQHLIQHFFVGTSLLCFYREDDWFSDFLLARENTIYLKGDKTLFLPTKSPHFRESAQDGMKVMLELLEESVPIGAKANGC